MTFDEILKLPRRHLSEAELLQYHDQGYLVFPGLIEKSRLRSLREIVARIVEDSRAVNESGRRIDLEPDHSAESPRIRRVTYIDEEYPAMWALCADSVVTDIAADLVGPNVRFRELMLNFKWAEGGAEVQWHQDLVFYPHTNRNTMQFLLYLEDVGEDQAPLQVVPGSHKGTIYPHYDDAGEWTGSIRDADMLEAGAQRAVALTGEAGTVTVHHSCTIHGSQRNTSSRGRPALVITYSAADAIPYTAPAYPSTHYRALVRGVDPKYAHHEEMHVPLPPDWSDGYTSIFEHQHNAAGPGAVPAGKRQ